MWFSQASTMSQARMVDLQAEFSLSRGRWMPPRGLRSAQKRKSPSIWPGGKLATAAPEAAQDLSAPEAAVTASFTVKREFLLLCQGRITRP